MQQHRNDWLYRQIVDEASDAILFADLDGRIEVWNTGAELIFGYTASEAVGQTLDLIIPEKLRARHWEGYRKVMASGSTRYDRELLAVPAVRKDGARISIELTVVLIRSSSEDVLGCAAIIRDVSTRWRKEQEMKARLAALEQKE